MKMIKFTMLTEASVDAFEFFTNHNGWRLGPGCSLERMDVCFDDEGCYYAYRCVGDIQAVIYWKKMCEGVTDFYLGWN